MGASMATLGGREFGAGRRYGRALVAAALASAVVATLASSANAASGPRAPHVPRVGKAPHPIAGHLVGSLASSTVLHADVALAPRDPAALAAFATAVSTPGNRLYRHFLARGQFAGRFGPTAGAIAAVERQLRSAGLVPGAISTNHLVIPVNATATTFARAFKTGFHVYRTAGARTVYANTAAPYLGSAARFVQGVVGLNDLTQFKPLDLERLAATGPRRASVTDSSGPQPCSAATSAARYLGRLHGKPDRLGLQLHEPLQRRGPWRGPDRGGLRARAELPHRHLGVPDLLRHLRVRQLHPRGRRAHGSPGGPDEQRVETELDIDNVIGLAPDATVDVYQAPNASAGVIDNYTAMVDDRHREGHLHVLGPLRERGAGPRPSPRRTRSSSRPPPRDSRSSPPAGDDGSTDCQRLRARGGRPSQPALRHRRRWHDDDHRHGSTGPDGVERERERGRCRWRRRSRCARDADLPVGGARGAQRDQRHSSGPRAGPRRGYLLPRGARRLGGRRSLHRLRHLLRRRVGRHRRHERRGAALGCPRCTDQRVQHVRRPPDRLRKPTLYKAAGTGYPSDFFDVTSGNNDYTPDGYSMACYPSGTGYDMASGLGTPNAATLPATLCADTVLTPSPSSTRAPRPPPSARPSAWQIAALDSASGQTLTYSATGLPAGLSITPDGLISGTPTTQAPHRRPSRRRTRPRCPDPPPSRGMSTLPPCTAHRGTTAPPVTCPVPPRQPVRTSPPPGRCQRPLPGWVRTTRTPRRRVA